MHSNNDKKDSGSSKGWIPSKNFDPYTGSNKETLARRERPRHESRRPDTRLGDISSTGAGSSRGKNS